MKIRKYQSCDLEKIVQLFYETVHAVNIKDYTEQQVNVWATGVVDWEKWNQSFQEHLTYVAVENNLVIGFGDMDKNGYLDRLFVHKDYQRQGVATALCDQLESMAGIECITVHASVTAKPFFEKRGYRIIKKQEVERQGILLPNYLMQKLL